MRNTRRPIVGDKLSSRMGQKGVIGAILPQEDMPYTADGLVPDLIVNPHAIPSRMTIGQLTECLLAILGAHTGERGDGTLFRGTSLEHICEELARHGYDRHGRTQLYNGFTGESFDATVFLGPTYYQRLRHMAADNDHGRARDRCTCSRANRPRAARATAVSASAKWSETAWTSRTRSSPTAASPRCATSRRASPRGNPVVVGAFDAAADRLVYEEMTELVVNRDRERAWIEMTSPDGVDLRVTERHILYVQRNGTGAFVDVTAGNCTTTPR